MLKFMLKLKEKIRKYPWDRRTDQENYFKGEKSKFIFCSLFPNNLGLQVEIKLLVYNLFFHLKGTFSQYC